MIVHAAGESAVNVKQGTYAVVLAARDEAHITNLEKRLQLQSIPHAAFREPDRNCELMSIGINPVEDRRSVRRFLRGFSLFGGNNEK